MTDAVPTSTSAFPWWVLIGACLLPCVYLPTLSMPFDFVDDGCLVYPSGASSLTRHVRDAWDDTLRVYRVLGPFQPVCLFGLKLQAELFQGDPLGWRVLHLIWAGLAAGTLLWLLRELGIPPAAALAAAALAMWNPYRGETWTHLRPAEALAMPFAFLALLCAVRAARSSHPGRLDLAGALCLLLALLCKNTFAALVPAQLLLRLTGGGLSLRAGWRRHGRHASLLTLTLLVPAFHFLSLKLFARPGQYRTEPPSWEQFALMVRTVRRAALSYKFFGVGLVLTLRALCRTQPGWWRRIGREQHSACLAAAALLTCGIAIYLPIRGEAGRYSMPAVWGADLGWALLFTALAALPATPVKRAAQATILCGLIGLAGANLREQEAFASHLRVLWRTLEWLERDAPAHSCLAWQSGPDLGWAEAVHFQRHLHARGRTDLTLQLLDEQGRPLKSDELDGASPRFYVSAGPASAELGPWQLLHVFSRRRCRCYLYQTLHDASRLGDASLSDAAQKR